MKKLSLLVLALLAGFTSSFAKSVSVTVAKTIGYNYLHQKNSTLKSAGDLNLSYTSTGAITVDFYIFSGSNCYVAVSADDGVVPILGYSAEGPFVTNHLSTNITGFFEDYNKQIDYVIKNNVAASPDIATQWDNLINNKSTPVNNRGMHSGSRTTGVFPSSTYWLLTTTWDQYPYYNADCPSDPAASSFGGQDVTGCVATAMAQVMKYWNWPTTGAGINSYATSSYGTLSSDFGAHTYGWTSMPNSVTGPNPAVALLMSDAGISVDMNYTPTESSAYVISSESPITNCTEYALRTYFGYASSLNGQPRSSYADPTWITMLETDIDANRPVIYTGQGTAGGHCFVFDGYDASDNFHVNWGWSGTDDGYYTIDALNPAILGTGGGAGGFNSDQTAIFGVQPDTSTTTTPPASLELYDNVNLTATTIGYGAAFTASTNIENMGTATFTGDFAAIAFDASGSFITYVDSVMGETLPAGDVFVSDLSFPTTGLLAMFPGSYTIGIFYRPTGGSWIAVANNSTFFYTNFAPITVVNSDPIELWAAMTPTPTPFVEGSAASVTLNLYNNGTYDFTGTGTYDFTGSFEVVLLNLDGSLNSTIQTMTGMSLPAGDDFTSLLTFSTASVTAAPGTYLLTTAYEYGGTGGWYYAGADFYQNPIYINVVAPPLSPDIYEPDNTAATAYDLTSTLTWVSNVAETGTPGSNFHIVTDQDYYKVDLAAGYNYTIHARVNDVLNSDDGSTYTVDCAWSYSTDGGTTWSPVYQNTIPSGGTINLSGGTGGTVIFHCSPLNPGQTGTYVLKLENITRVGASLVPGTSVESVKIYPNPASDNIAIDFSGTGISGIEAALFDMQGKKVYSADISNQPVFTIPVNSLAAGIYFVQVSTDAGMINKKITVSSK